MSVSLLIAEGPVPGMGGDPERGARAMYRSMGALGSMALDNVFGDVWCRPQLSRRDRSLVVISALMSLQSVEELKGHIRIGLNHGLTREEISEILLTVAGYAGFPTAMPASRILDDVLRTSTRSSRGGGSRSAPQRPRRATSSVGRTPPTCAAPWPALRPPRTRRRSGPMGGPVGELVYDFHFGEIWCRPEMSRRDRSLCVISILVALSMPAQLSFHIPAGLNHGLSREEVEEVMVQFVIYGGFPRSVVGMASAKQAFKKLDEKKAKM